MADYDQVNDVTIEDGCSETVTDTVSASLSEAFNGCRKTSVSVNLTGFARLIASIAESSRRLSERLQPTANAIRHMQNSMAPLAKAIHNVTNTEYIVRSNVAGHVIETLKVGYRLPKPLFYLSDFAKRFCIRISITIAAISTYTDLFVKVRNRVSVFTGSLFKQSLHVLSHVIRFLYSLWDRRPHRHPLPDKLLIKRAASIVQINLPPPILIREFAIEIRESFLQKHQRISDDSDDLDDSFLPIVVAA